jgi:large subunit ribosomal protein L21
VLAIGGETGLKLGQPTVSGAKVTASVVGLEKGEKIFIQKFRRRKNYEVRTGHRQKYTRIKIESIDA